MSVSCIIVDDEPIAISLVESYVLKTPFLKLEGKFSNAIQAMEFLSNHPVDLLFLDIQMPDVTGIELSKMIPSQTRVIFTTAFDEYALEGFKVKALDYLLKPFDYSEFLAAASKAKEWFDLIQKPDTPVVNNVTAVENSENEFLFVKSEYKQLKIKLKDVLYFESMKDYIKIWVKTEDKPILTLMSLKSLEEKLSDKMFMRVHRSFIVNLDNIEVIERSQIIINKQRITVSEQYKSKFTAFIENNSLI